MHRMGLVQQDCQEAVGGQAFGSGGSWKGAKGNYQVLQEMPKTEVRTRTKEQWLLNPAKVTHRDKLGTAVEGFLGFCRMSHFLSISFLMDRVHTC